ncbi:MAG: hypothetical protein GY862_36065 [Gammaproteobacteria bacterium]|nr:hypothetical protein [Gammaproteobacteria bacterium]
MKHLNFLKLSIIILLLAGGAGRTETAADPDAALNVSTVRTSLQGRYANETAWKVIEYVQAYAVKFGTAPTSELAEVFSRELLQNGTDSIVQSVIYQPDFQRDETSPAQDFVTVYLQNSSFVESLLQGKYLTYRLTESGWVIDEKLSTAPAPDKPPVAPTTELGWAIAKIAAECVPISNNAACLGISAKFAINHITEHCRFPAGVQMEGASLSDRDWCPLWHQFIQATAQTGQSAVHDTPLSAPPGTDLEWAAAKVSADCMPAGSRSCFTVPIELTINRVTEHCRVPAGYRMEDGKLSDNEWCPPWHEFIQPAAGQ